MDQVISMLALMLGIILVLSLINTVVGVFTRVNMRSMFVVALILGASFLVFQGFTHNPVDISGDGLTGAVVSRVDDAIPEYIDSGETCSEIEKKQKLGEKYKIELCDDICGEQKNLGNRCADDRFLCKCW